MGEEKRPLEVGVRITRVAEEPVRRWEGGREWVARKAMKLSAERTGSRSVAKYGPEGRIERTDALEIRRICEEEKVSSPFMVLNMDLLTFPSRTFFSSLSRLDEMSAELLPFMIFAPT